MENKTSNIDPTPRLSEVSSAARPESALDEIERATNYLNGWALHLLTTAINNKPMLAIFPPQAKGIIAATALVFFTSNLRAFNEAAGLSWHTGSHRLVYFHSMIMHMCWSANNDPVNHTQSFQGMGASGTHAFATVIQVEVARFLELVLCNFTTWWWMFILIVIPGAFAAVLLISFFAW
ncbi:hypothetical protein DID88_001264 [Monilinia fructigena]|uniref:Uncharacterized protein n=1 Tax=Monilinia fructigena TaxID=38457 RepID=A0A395IZC6_9HELO|nr:hypothetical protein DID88_001264 [Monilinia fructigena]